MTLVKNWKIMPNGKEKRHAYYASPEWGRLRKAVRERSGGICERCNNAQARDTHHQTYARLYNERLDDLLHVCGPCHEFIGGHSDIDPCTANRTREIYGKKEPEPVSLREVEKQFHAMYPPKSTPKPQTRPTRVEEKVMVCGKQVQSVYLAGKISGSSWRDQLVVKANWSRHNHGVLGNFPYDSDSWTIARGALATILGRPLDLTGPYWTPLGCCGGHCTITRCSCGPHNAGVDDGFNHGSMAVIDRMAVADRVMEAIKQCDLFFAWLETGDEFGTIAEIGLARGLNKVVVVASSTNFASSEFWLSHAFADRTIHAKSPKEAWMKLWLNPALRTGIDDEHSDIPNRYLEEEEQRMRDEEDMADYDDGTFDEVNIMDVWRMQSTTVTDDWDEMFRRAMMK